MYVTCLEQQSFCHARRKNLKFKLLYFQNKECYPAENKQADGNLDFLICDEDKNPKLCLVMNFSFLWRHVKTKNSTQIAFKKHEQTATKNANTFHRRFEIAFNIAYNFFSKKSVLKIACINSPLQLVNGVTAFYSFTLWWPSPDSPV